MASEKKAGEAEVLKDKDGHVLGTAAARGLSFEAQASCMQHVTVSYLSPLLGLGADKQLDIDDLGLPHPQDATRRIFAEFDRQYDQAREVAQFAANAAGAKKGRKVTAHVPMLSVLFRVVGWGVIFLSAFLRLCQAAAGLARPIVFERLIISLVDPTVTESERYFWAGAQFVLPLFNAQFNMWHDKAMARVSVQVKTALQSSLYRKALRISLTSSGMDTGGVVNLMSQDTGMVMNYLWQMHNLWVAPITIGFGLYLLNQQVDEAAFAGVGVLFAIAPFNVFIFKKLYQYYGEKVKLQDKRVKLINEIISGIRIIKFYAWETPFLTQIAKVRLKEMQTNLKFLYAIALGFQLVLGSTVVIMLLVVFAVYAGNGGVLTTARAFTTIQLFDTIRGPFISLPGMLVAYLQAKLSLGRIRDFLAANELAPASHHDVPTGDGGAASASDPRRDGTISINKGEFTYPTAPEDPPEVKAKKEKIAKYMSDQAKAAAKKEGKSEEDIEAAGKEAAWKAMGKDPEKEKAKGGEEATPFKMVVDEFSVAKGELVAVVGAVGNGKSSVLKALLGEMVRHTGSVEVKGTVAYVAQKAWILNATVRDNIVFGEEFDEDKYNDVLKTCALESDLKVLPGGDQCEIGEKGINLSGGQQQRISLARAVYRDADIYLADDPLSAVDAHVGDHLFHKCFAGALKEKTRVLVTNQLQFLPDVDKVFVVAQGRIVESGSYLALMQRGGAFSELLRKLGMDEGEDDEGADGEAKDGEMVRHRSYSGSEGSRSRGAAVRRRARSRLSGARSARSGTIRKRRASTVINQLGGLEGGDADSTDARSEASGGGRERTESEIAREEGKLVEEEEREEGFVDRRAYYYYVKSVHPFSVGLAIFMMAAVQGFGVYNSFWIGDWSAAGDNDDLSFFMWGFAAISFSSIFAMFVESIVSARAFYGASVSLHDKLLNSVVRAPVSWFDQVPTGRILNRFSKDVSTIDQAVGRVLSFAVMSVMTLIAAIVGIAVSTNGLFLVVLPFVGVVYYKIQLYIRKTGVEVQRLDSTLRSPVFTSFKQALEGLETIRAYGVQARFVADNDKKLDNGNLPGFILRLLQMWLSVRLELIGATVSCAVAVFSVATLGTEWALPVQFVAVALNYSTQLTSGLQSVVESVAGAEGQMNSVERVMEYAENVKSEAPVEIEDTKPPAEWPQQGAVQFDNYSLRYRPDKPLVLRGIDLSIKPKEKIGVVGRTGAGKSSLMVGLFRIVEPAGGHIAIDGVNTSTIGLDDLRSKLGIIPQDPVLFVGTVRYNLDPFGQYDGNDAPLLVALEKAQLKDTLSLDDEVEEEGSNFSVGERQLICMARALLRSPKVLVLDEATANIDSLTDAKIQSMIRTAFKDATVATIAHRLETIMDSDRVLVLDKGEVAEYDTPAKLVDMEGGIFKSMVEVTGKQTADRLRAIARGELEVAAFIRSADAGASAYDLELDETDVPIAGVPLGFELEEPDEGVGAIVSSVAADASPQIKAGVQPGDVILKVAGAPQDMTPFAALTKLITSSAGALKDGHKLMVTFGRPVPGGATGLSGSGSGDRGAASGAGAGAVSAVDVVPTVPE